MSVLLDALKNAALEKQKREQEHTAEIKPEDGLNDIAQELDLSSVDLGDEEPGEATSSELTDIAEEVNLSAITIDNEEKENEDEAPISEIRIPENHVEMLIDIDLDELETKLDETISNISEQEPVNKTQSAHQKISELSPLETAREAEEHADNIDVTETVTDAAHSHSDANSDAINQDQDNNTSTENDPKQTTGQAQDNSKTDAVEKQRASFQELLQTNKRLTRERKVKFFTLYVTSMVILAAAIFAYYSYVMSKDTGLALSIPQRPLETIATPIDPVVEEEVTEVPLATETTAADETSSTPEEGKKSRNLLVEVPVKNNSTTKPMVIMPKKSVKQTEKKVTPPTVETPTKNKVIEIGKSKPDTLQTTIKTAFQAFNRGDYATAESTYFEAWKIAPDNRDVILGRAAVALKLGKYEQAMALYQNQLELDPQDDFAHTGMLSIASIGNITPSIVSQVNNLLKDHPEAAHLHFLKGALHARQFRWAAAQASFFNAWTRDSQRAEYAYNLAISLDHIGQQSEALRFYRKSLDLAKQSGNDRAIDTASASQRITQLEASFE